MTDRRLGASHAAEWLAFAATPTFALMAALTGFPNGAVHEMSCSGATHTSQLAGMAPMYALMSAFHLLPWLKFVSRRGALPRRVLTELGSGRP
jgi:hypothetical protein